MQYEYLIILAIIFVTTLVFELKYHIDLYKTRKERFLIVGLFFIVGVIWDSFATWRGHWVFPEGMNLGLTIGQLPVEEYLFILIVPYFIITFYKLIDSKFKARDDKKN